MHATIMLRALVIFFAPASMALAAVITDTHILLSAAPDLPEYDYQLTIYQNPGYPDPTSIVFDREGGDLIFRGVNLDEGSDWYFADAGDLFNAQTIGQNNFAAFNLVDRVYPVGYGEFYFGVNTTPGLQPELGRNIFGWAHMRNSDTGLELLGSGVSYDFPGIIIGTTLVPEPGLTLSAGGALVMLMRRRRRP